MTSILVASLLCALPPARPRSAPAASDSSPPSSEQLSDQQIRDRIDTFMGTIDTRITPEQWRALGPRGAAMLEQIAQDPNAFPTRRAKAVTGLSEVGLSRSASGLLGLAESGQAPPTVGPGAGARGAGVLGCAQIPTALQP